MVLVTDITPLPLHFSQIMSKGEQSLQYVSFQPVPLHSPQEQGTSFSSSFVRYQTRTSTSSLAIPTFCLYQLMPITCMTDRFTCTITERTFFISNHDFLFKAYPVIILLPFKKHIFLYGRTIVI